MKRLASLLSTDPLWQQLTEDEETASAALFRELCQASPALRHWLWHDFAHDAGARDSFKQALNDPVAGQRWDASFAGPREAWQIEQRQLRETMPVTYGGLSRLEVEQLIRYYQAAGTVEPGVFLLARHWHQKKGSARLTRATLLFLETAVKSGQPNLLNDFCKSLGYLEAFKRKANRAAVVGYADWWKLNLMLYLLQNPRQAYRMRDLDAHLKALGLTVDLRQLQRFCAQHHIARESGAGRPRRQSLRPNETR